jgi:hypothetical protein
MLLACLALGLASCGDECRCPAGTTPDPASVPLVVSSIQPSTFIGYASTPFTIHGSGFSRSAAPGSTDPLLVLVNFLAPDDIPFANRTTAEAPVLGTVISDTEIQGMTPITDQTGTWPCAVQVTDAFGSDFSPGAIAEFTGLTVFTISPGAIPSDQATPFQVHGLAFGPVGGQATVRFTSLLREFPVASDTFDLIVDVISPELVTGVTPTFPLTTPLPTYVKVILHELPGLPQASSTSALTVFEPPPPIPVEVTGITPPLPLESSVSFTLTGSGFLPPGGDPIVEVTFTAFPETPFFGGTASTAAVACTAASDGTITGMSPTGTALADVTAFVTVTRRDGITDTSATRIALFTVPLVTVSTLTPDLLPSDAITPLVIDGTNLPTGQTVTVRIRAIQGTPFLGGTSATVDVVASVTSPTRIDGFSPLAVTTDAVLCEADVTLLSGAQFPMGAECIFLPPAAPPATCVVTNRDDDGPGSLRDMILNATPGCIITFDSSLNGDIDLDSSLQVPHDVQIAGPSPDVIRVSAANGNFPVFTVSPGAVASISELTIHGSRNDLNGGAARVSGNLSLVRCVLANHEIGGSGAGVYVDLGGSATLFECTLEDNKAGVRGGAVFVATGGTAHLEGCTLNDNKAESGGGALALEPNSLGVDMVNCTLHDNEAEGGPGGGAILVPSNTSVTLLHCTITENVADNRGGGVLIQGGDFTASNCIFSRNADGKGFPEIAFLNGTNTTTFSLVRTGVGSGLSDGDAGNQVGNGFTPIDPELGPLQLNGGPTRTQALLQGSPALDVGDPATCPPADQRGQARPVGPGCDLGAYEATVTL